MTINNESAVGLEKYQINVEEFADSNLSFNFLVIEKFFDDPSKKKELLGKSVDELYKYCWSEFKLVLGFLLWR